MGSSLLDAESASRLGSGEEIGPYRYAAPVTQIKELDTFPWHV